jgi:hypothetical protein
MGIDAIQADSVGACATTSHGLEPGSRYWRVKRTSWMCAMCLNRGDKHLLASGKLMH